MTDDFIGRQIQRTNRNLLLTGVFLLAVIAGATALYWRDIHNYVFGPFPVQPTELAAISDPTTTPHYYVRVQGDKSFQTDFHEVDADDHKHVTAELQILSVGDRFLIVKTPSDTEQVSFRGRLLPIPTELQTGLVHKWDQKHPDAQGAFFPYLLDATGIWDWDAGLTAFAGLLFFTIGLVPVAMVLSRWSRPDQHPLLRKLQAYGLAQDVRGRIDSEVRGQAGASPFNKSLHLTTSWILHVQPYKTEVMQVRDVLWAYQKTTKHYHNGIPTGKSFSAILRDSKGQSLEIAGKKDTVPQFLQSLPARMPWVYLGYNQELDGIWQKQKPRFFQMMEQRRAKLAPATR